MRPHNEDSLGWGRIGALEDPRPDAEAAGRHAGGQVKPPKLLRAAFEAANLDIFHAALDGAGTAKMQTTMSALILSPGEAHLGHVGDGRVYRRQGEDVDLLTTDHTQVMEMLRMRMITPEQAAEHPARHALTRSLGAELITRTDIRQEPVRPGDTFLLCTDGLWGKVDLSEIRSALVSDDLEAACAELVAMAVDRGGEDNSTIVMVRVTHTAEAVEKPAGWRRFFQ